MEFVISGALLVGIFLLVYNENKKKKEEATKQEQRKIKSAWDKLCGVYTIRFTQPIWIEDAWQEHWTVKFSHTPKFFPGERDPVYNFEEDVQRAVSAMARNGVEIYSESNPDGVTIRVPGRMIASIDYTTEEL